MNIVQVLAQETQEAMMKVNEFEDEFILDLNKIPYEEHTIKIHSRGENDSRIPWGIEMVSSELVSASMGADDSLIVTVDIENMKDESFILLRNYAKERMKIILKPNILLTSPKAYKFRITKKTTDGRKTRIRILSKEDNNEIGWKCTYDGKPLNYSINPRESDKSGYVDIELLDELFIDNIPTVLEFTQNKSCEVIELRLNQTNDDTEIIKAD